MVILICDHQEKHNKVELTHGAGERIKEVEENITDQVFREPGESTTTTRLRVQEEIHQKASAALFDKVSIIVMSGHWIFLCYSDFISKSSDLVAASLTHFVTRIEVADSGHFLSTP